MCQWSWPLHYNTNGRATYSKYLERQVACISCPVSPKTCSVKTGTQITPVLECVALKLRTASITIYASHTKCMLYKPLIRPILTYESES